MTCPIFGDNTDIYTDEYRDSELDFIFSESRQADKVKMFMRIYIAGDQKIIKMCH